MGRLSLDGMLEVADQGAALLWHLKSNHFPPVPERMIPACKRAIECGDEGEEWDEEIPMPEGTTWRGKVTAPAWAIIEGFHLEGFLDGAA